MKFTFHLFVQCSSTMMKIKKFSTAQFACMCCCCCCIVSLFRRQLSLVILKLSLCLSRICSTKQNAQILPAFRLCYSTKNIGGENRTEKNVFTNVFGETFWMSSSIDVIWQTVLSTFSLTSEHMFLFMCTCFGCECESECVHCSLICVYVFQFA